MNEKTKNILMIVVSAALIFGFSLACLLHSPVALSKSERRPLAQFPTLSLADLLSGAFMEGFEDYAPDQFPLRESFRQLKAIVQYKLLGMKDNNGVYSVDGVLSKLEYPLSENNIHRAAAKFEALYTQYMAGRDIKAYYAIVPDKNYFLAAENGYPALDYVRLVELMNENITNLSYIDIFDCLSIANYYATDTHWRQECLSAVVARIAAEMDFSGRLFGAYETKSLTDFYGVYSGQWAISTEPETLYYLTNAIIESCVVYNYETKAYTSVYDLNKAEGSDPYDIFLSGAAALLTVENPNATTDKELIIFRDSFGSAVAPLFLEAYAKVTLVDIRYISSDYLGQFLEFDGQDVLFLYSTMLLNNSMSLK